MNLFTFEITHSSKVEKQKKIFLRDILVTIVFYQQNTFMFICVFHSFLVNVVVGVKPPAIAEEEHELSHGLRVTLNQVCSGYCSRPSSSFLESIAMQ